jgi:uncharacterized protein (TIGR02145 family)
MKSTSGWDNNRNSTNSSGFSGLPGGYRGCAGSYTFIGEKGSWWTSTVRYSYKGTAWYRYLSNTNPYICKGEMTMEIGLSVRCIKD